MREERRRGEVERLKTRVWAWSCFAWLRDFERRMRECRMEIDRMLAFSCLRTLRMVLKTQ